MPLFRYCCKPLEQNFSQDLFLLSLHFFSLSFLNSVVYYKTYLLAYQWVPILMVSSLTLPILMVGSLTLVYIATAFDIMTIFLFKTPVPLALGILQSYFLFAFFLKILLVNHIIIFLEFLLIYFLSVFLHSQSPFSNSFFNCVIFSS